MADRYWIASTAQNWNSTSCSGGTCWATTSGGAGGASVPVSGDTARFDGNGTGDCTLTGNITVDRLVASSGYTGTFDSANYSITNVSGLFYLNVGTWDFGTSTITFNDSVFFAGGTHLLDDATAVFASAASDTFTSGGNEFGNITVQSGTWDWQSGNTVINGTFAQSGGTMAMSTSNKSITFKGDVNITGGTWTKGTGTITLSGTAAQDVDFNSETIEDLVIDKTSGTVTFSGGFTTDSFDMNASGGSVDFGDSALSYTVSGDFTADGTGTVDLGDASFTIGGNYDLSTQGTYTRGTSTTTLTGTGKTLTSSSANRPISITVATGATISFTAVGVGYVYGTWVVDGTLTLSSNAFPLSNAVITVNGTVDGTGQLKGWNTITLNSGGSIANSTIWMTGGTLTVNGGTIDLSSYALFEFDTTINGTLDPIVFTAAGTTTMRGGGSANTLTIAQNIQFNTDVSVNHTGAGTYTIDPGTNNKSIELTKDIDIGIATGTVAWTKGTGTITLAPPAATTISLDFDGKTIEDIVIDGSGTAELTGTFTTDSLTCTNGTLDVNLQNITVVGNMTVAAGCSVIE